MRTSLAYIYMIQAVIAEEGIEMQRPRAGEPETFTVAVSASVILEAKQPMKLDTIAEHREPSAALETKIGLAAD